MAEKQDTVAYHDEHNTQVQEANHEALHDPVRTKKLVRSIDLRLMPLLAWIYLLNYLDRGNIGNARVLNQETGDSFVQKTKVTPTQYAIILSVFSLAYTLFEVPSNWIMKRFVRPSIWLAALLFGWGAMTMGTAGVKNYHQVLILRFFIGMFEAGFFPGVIFLITFWYRPEERALRIAFVVASATLAGAFGGVVAFGMGHLNGAGGLEGFRWLFLIEGLISLLSCLPILFLLPDWPERSWLSKDDAKFATDRLEGLGHTTAHSTRKEMIETCFSPRMLGHYFTYILDCVPLGSLTFYTPTIVAGLGYNSVRAQLMSVSPWVIGYVASLALAWSADRFNARGLHVAAASTVGGIGWLCAGLLPTKSYLARYGCLMLCACGAFPSAAPLSAWVTCNVPSLTTIGIAVALNNSGAGVSQIISQWIWRNQEKAQGYPTGNFTCAGCSFGVVAMSLLLRWHYRRMNARGLLDAGGKPRTWLT